MKNEHIGKIIDGRWEVISLERYPNSRGGKYLLRNIYNGNEVTIKDVTLYKIEKGETTLSKVMANKFTKEKGYRQESWKRTKWRKEYFQ